MLELLFDISHWHSTIQHWGKICGFPEPGSGICFRSPSKVYHFVPVPQAETPQHSFTGYCPLSRTSRV